MWIFNCSIWRWVTATSGTLTRGDTAKVAGPVVLALIGTASSGSTLSTCAGSASGNMPPISASKSSIKFCYTSERSGTVKKRTAVGRSLLRRWGVYVLFDARADYRYNSKQSCFILYLFLWQYSFLKPIFWVFNYYFYPCMHDKFMDTTFAFVDVCLHLTYYLIDHKWIFYNHCFLLQ